MVLETVNARIGSIAIMLNLSSRLCAQWMRSEIIRVPMPEPRAVCGMCGLLSACYPDRRFSPGDQNGES